MTFSVARGLMLATAFISLTLIPACIAQVPPASPGLAGNYKVDPTHVSVTFKVSHMGLSKYTGRFAGVDASAFYDPENPAKSRVEASIDPRSVRTDYSATETRNFDRDLAGPDWFNAIKFPAITFKSTAIEVTGPATAKIKGDLTMLGVTRPIVLDTTMNGAMTTHPFTLGPAFGISATGVVDRAAFGLNAYEGMVGTEVTILIEAEFQKK